MMPLTFPLLLIKSGNERCGFTCQIC